MNDRVGWRTTMRWAAFCCLCLLPLGGPARWSAGATLQSLLAGGTLDVGNSRFSQWQLVLLDATAAAPDFAQIMVNPLVSSPSQPGIQFTAGGQFTTIGSNSIDMILRYRVDALAGTNTFTQQVLEMGTPTLGGSNEVVQITTEMSDGVASDLGSTIVYADHGVNLTQLADTQEFVPKSQVVVTTNVFLNGLAGDSAMLASFIQRLAQNGAPGKPGDYNQNGAVDTADYTLWRNKLGMPAGTLPNDSAGGAIGMAQYNLWKSNFGMAGSGSEGLLGATVPEPATGLAFWGAAMAGLTLRRRKSFL